MNSTIVLELIEAKELLAADSNGLSDPFCSVVPVIEELKSGGTSNLVEIRKEKIRTKVCYKTLTPKWNEMFTLGEKTVLPQRGWILIKIKDKDVIGEDDLGEVKLPFDFATTDRNRHQSWHKVEPRKSMKIKPGVKGCGQICLAITVTPALSGGSGSAAAAGGGNSIGAAAARDSKSNGGVTSLSAAGNNGLISKDAQLFHARLSSFTAPPTVDSIDEHTWILTGMEKYAGHESVQELSMKALQAVLAQSTQMAKLRQKMGITAIREVVRAMDVFEENQSLQVSGMGVLSKLCLDHENKEMFVTLDGIDILLKALKTFGDRNYHLAADGCAVLYYIALGDPVRQQHIVEKGACFSVMTIIKSFSQQPLVLMDAFNCVACLCNKHARAQTDFLSFDMLDSVLKALAEFRDNEHIVVGGAMILSALSQKVEQLILIKQKNGHTLLQSIRDQYMAKLKDSQDGRTKPLKAALNFACDMLGVELPSALQPTPPPANAPGAPAALAAGAVAASGAPTVVHSGSVSTAAPVTRARHAVRPSTILTEMDTRGLAALAAAESKDVKTSATAGGAPAAPPAIIRASSTPDHPPNDPHHHGAPSAPPVLLHAVSTALTAKDVDLSQTHTVHSFVPTPLAPIPASPTSRKHHLAAPLNADGGSGGSDIAVLTPTALTAALSAAASAAAPAPKPSTNTSSSLVAPTPRTESLASAATPTAGVVAPAIAAVAALSAGVPITPVAAVDEQWLKENVRVVNVGRVRFAGRWEGAPAKAMGYISALSTDSAAAGSGGSAGRYRFEKLFFVTPRGDDFVVVIEGIPPLSVNDAHSNGRVKLSLAALGKQTMDTSVTTSELVVAHDTDGDTCYIRHVSFPTPASMAARGVTSQIVCEGVLAWKLARAD